MATAKTQNDNSKRVEDAIDVSKKTTERLLNTSGKSLDKATTEAREQVNQAAKHMVNLFELVNQQIKQSQVTASEMSQVVLKSSEEINKAITTAGQRISEVAVKYSKDGMNSRSLPDYLAVQAEAARSIYDTLLAEVTQISDAAVNAGQNVINPLQKHVVESAERAANSL